MDLDMRQIEPRAVVETKRVKGQLGKFIYNGEVSFYGEHYVVAPNAESYEKAKEVAEQIASAIKANLIALGKNALKQFPTAKE